MSKQKIVSKKNKKNKVHFQFLWKVSLSPVMDSYFQVIIAMERSRNAPELKIQVIIAIKNN